MKNIAILLPVLVIAVLGIGCVAIPMGTETFTTEYPAAIRPTANPPRISCEVEPMVSSGDEGRRTAAIGILVKKTTEQAQVQEFSGVEVIKKKRVAIGFFPGHASKAYHPTGALTPVGRMVYLGGGKYGNSNFGSKEPVGGWGVGATLSSLSLGILSTPFSMMAGIFGPYEKDYHFLGGSLESSRNAYRSSSYTYFSNDIDLLLKFPMSEREKIGAWTYHENDTHPQNTFWHGFDMQWVGVSKYCNYFVKDKGRVSKTMPTAPNISTREKIMLGPYSIVLTLPSLGFAETVEVESGKTAATFNLLDVANGDSFANGTVRFLPPPGGLTAISDEDDRAIFELAMEREWPVTVALPAPRIDKVGGVKTDGGGEPRQAGALYQIASIGHTADGKGIVVRVTVNDTSKMFDVDRTVQPEVRRMFREQFAKSGDANRRENVRMETADSGKTLVYTVTFE